MGKKGILLVFGLLLGSGWAIAQKVGKPVKVIPEKPKVGKPIIIKKAETEKVKTVFVKPTEGYLALTTTPNAMVSLNSAKAVSAKKRKPVVYAVGPSGILKVSKLKPGGYSLQIERTDFESFTKEIEIVKGDQTIVNQLLTSKYGTVTFGLGNLATPDVKVLIDDGKFSLAEKLTVADGKITIRNVPVGVHDFLVIKPDYLNWERKKVEIKPAEAPDNFIQVDLNPATVFVTLESVAGASVYINNEPRAKIGEDGKSAPLELLPDKYEIEVVKNGYITIKRAITVTLDKREITEPFQLLPATEDTERSDDFDERLERWTAGGKSWKLDAGQRCLSTEDVALFNKNTKGLNFNRYDNYILVMSVSLSNERGAAWVLRAQDDLNYFLFELTTAQSQVPVSDKNSLIFYVCRAGNCARKESSPVSVDTKKTGNRLRIKVEVKGKRIQHFLIDSNSAPLGQVFEDDSLAFGGVGFRAIHGISMCFDQFLVSPIK